MTARPRRRWLAPEVIQTSAMDCGPAALKCLLDGHGIPVNYGRLRDVCHTDVDGTSIDTIETISQELGLDTEQVMVPIDHVLLPEAETLPAVAVVRLPHGMTHFVVVWETVGSFVQVMDPARGRRWVSRTRFLDELHVHEMTVSAEEWRTWAETDDAIRPLTARLHRLGVRGAHLEGVIATAHADSTWRGFGRLDAVTRMVETITRAHGLKRGAEATRAIEHLLTVPQETIPATFWSVRAHDSADSAALRIRGAVMVRVRGVSDDAVTAPVPASTARLTGNLREDAAAPLRELVRLLRPEGAGTLVGVAVGIVVAAIGVLLEVVLFRGLVDLGRDLVAPEQRWVAAGMLFGVALVMLGIQFLLTSTLTGLGRRLEGRLRIRLLEKIPRLGDRYFQSRLVSDIAERAHNVHTLRTLPELTGRCARAVAEVVLTTGALIWLDPTVWVPAVLLATVVVGIPLLAQPALSEQDLRQRTHAGAMTRFYLDALLGLVAIKAHGAQRALRREHEQVLAEWWWAGLAFVRTTATLEGVQTALALALTAWLLVTHLSAGGDASSLLVLYWGMRLHVLGDDFALVIRQYPAVRNITLRLLEPLTMPDEQPSPRGRPAAATIRRGVSIVFDHVGVQVGGHPILREVDLSIPSGSHVAIVGPSGAGKSTLVGLLLGWHVPASGEMRVDEQPLDTVRQQELRQHTAWVDPAVQLWNRSLFENLRYGMSGPREPVSLAVDAANLGPLVEKLPDGLRTSLGEGGALVSGGEGQRVRFARALLKPGVRLAILDEPFRGLDRTTRRACLSEARRHWKDATLLCVTHDIADTVDFDLVIVIENGTVSEAGDPSALAHRSESRYASILVAEHTVREQIWADSTWRRLVMGQGRISEPASEASVHAS